MPNSWCAFNHVNSSFLFDFVRWGNMPSWIILLHDSCPFFTIFEGTLYFMNAEYFNSTPLELSWNINLKNSLFLWSFQIKWRFLSLELLQKILCLVKFLTIAQLYILARIVCFPYWFWICRGRCTKESRGSWY